jgi:hypothetical protein
VLERLKVAEADAYATSLAGAVEICVKAARGELKSDMAAEAAKADAAGTGGEGGEPDAPPPRQPAPRRVA